MPRPDFSNFVAHFTKDRLPFGANRLAESFLEEISGDAMERLISIVEQRRIYSTPMPYARDWEAVAFTECPWTSLFDHARHYSPYGIGFRKETIFSHGGGPAIYIRQDHFQAQLDAGGFAKSIQPFLTPFVPDYASQSHLDQYWPSKNPIDYTHEREWRCPRDFRFAVEDIEFIVVERTSDLDYFRSILHDGFSPDRFLVLEVHKQIKSLWPAHGW